jgi:hypothetical protein
MFARPRDSKKNGATAADDVQRLFVAWYREDAGGVPTGADFARRTFFLDASVSSSMTR